MYIFMDWKKYEYNGFYFLQNVFFSTLNLDSNKTEIKDAERIAFDYLRSDPSHRDLDTPIIKTKQAYEPIHFTGFFGPWDKNYWTVTSCHYFCRRFISKNCFLVQNIL